MRASYVWLLITAALGIYAAYEDVHGGIWGASRDALTVGFLATMAFGIGQRVLPAFCGMRLLFSKRLMGISLVVLNAGCFLRVLCEIPAYEANLHAAWLGLPVSAITELTAVTLFGLNTWRSPFYCRLPRRRCANRFLLRCIPKPCDAR